MEELQMLHKQLDKLPVARSKGQRIAIEKSVLLWGTRLHDRLPEIERVLEKQLIWLETHNDHPKQDERFAEWEALLRQYEDAVRTLERVAA